MRYMLPAIVSIGLSGAFAQGPDTIRASLFGPLFLRTGRPVHHLGADAFQVTVDGSPAAFQAREVRPLSRRRFNERQSHPNLRASMTTRFREGSGQCRS